MSDQASGKAEHGVAEEAAKPVASSAHFPRITKHDLEVVVEAMDKLRAALKAEEEEKPDFSKCSCHHCCQSLETNGKLACDCGCKVCSIAAPPSVDGLEGRCRFEIDMAMLGTPLKAPGVKEREAIAQKFASVIRTRDRDLVEKLEGLAAKWEKENSLRSDDSYRYPQQLRAVLAARNEK